MFQKGDIVQLKKEVEEQWEKDGEFSGHGWVLRGRHKVDRYEGTTLYTDEGLGFHNADQILEKVIYA